MTDEYKHKSGKKKPKYTRESAASRDTISRRIEKTVKIKDTANAPTARKRIMIQCPACKKTYVLTGAERSEYLRKIKKNQYKLGRPCSPECQKDIAIPAKRLKMEPVFHKIREIAPLKKKSPGRPKGSKEKVQYVEPLLLRELRENAAID